MFGPCASRVELSSITSGATGALSTWPSSCMNALHLDTCEVWLIPTVCPDLVTCGAKLPTCAMEIPGVWVFLCPATEVSLRVIKVIVSICRCFMYTYRLDLDG